METIKFVAIGACVSIVFYGLVIMMAPKGALSKTFKNFVGVAIVASIVISAVKALNKGDFKLELQTPSFETTELKNSFNETVFHNQQQSIENSIQQLVFENLKIYDIKTEDVSVVTDILDNGLISIIRVDIECDKNDSDKVKKALNHLGLEISIIETTKGFNNEG